MHGHFCWCVSLLPQRSYLLDKIFCTAILVGDAQSWVPALVEHASRLVVNGGFEPDADLYVFLLFRHPCSYFYSRRGPLISDAAKRRVASLIGSVEQEGGVIHLDGRNITVSAYPAGNFVGPTIIEVDTTMRAYK